MSSTPWMIACDKKDFIGLVKLYESLPVQIGRDNNSLVSHVLFPSEADGGNTALHYAALSDFSEALKILALVLSAQDKCSLFDSFITLLSKGNHNGDTPIMMLCVKDFSVTLDIWITLGIQMGLEQGLSWDQIHPKLTQILQLKNLSQDTALSLAYGFGNNKVMECLLKDRISTIREASDNVILNSVSYDRGIPLANLNDDLAETSRMVERDVSNKSSSRSESVLPLSYKTELNNTSSSNSSLALPMGDTFLLYASHEDIEKCKRVLYKVEIFIQTLQKRDPTDNTSTKEGLKRKDDIRRSLVILQVSSTRLAQKRMTELLELEDYSLVQSQKKKDTNRKKSTKLLKNEKKKPEQEEGGSQCIQNTRNNIEKHKFTTLSDGTIVSNKMLVENAEFDGDLDESYNRFHSKQKSTEDLLKDRCIDGMKADDFSIDATLKSLCLEPSMLLLTAHGMALQLSPSQLDTVELLLKNQLDAVGHAKGIQSRLLSTDSI